MVGLHLNDLFNIINLNIIILLQTCILFVEVYLCEYQGLFSIELCTFHSKEHFESNKYISSPPIHSQKIFPPLKTFYSKKNLLTKKKKLSSTSFNFFRPKNPQTLKMVTFQTRLEHYFTSFFLILNNFLKTLFYKKYSWWSSKILMTLYLKLEMLPIVFS